MQLFAQKSKIKTTEFKDCKRKLNLFICVLTGHEAAFAAFLCCLCKVGVLKVDDQLAMVFKVFNRWVIHGHLSLSYLK